MSADTPVCIFEDRGWRTLLPVTWLHSPCELFFGTCTIIRRVKQAFPGRSIHFAGRPWIVPVMRERYGFEAPPVQSTGLFINARLMAPEAVRDFIEKREGNISLWHGDTLIAARFAISDEIMIGEDIPRFVGEMKVPRIDYDARMMDRWWDAIYIQEEALTGDTKAFFEARELYGPPACTGTFLAGEAIVASETARIDPGGVIDARNGPVVIDHHAHIGSGAILVGPLYIGPNCLVKPLAHIGPGVSLGPCSKVGGEIARSIFLGYANKQHDGYLGHAYISNWVNLGAGTTNSNLKNTYGTVQVWVDGEFEDSGKTFVGCAIGDHSKTAIGTTLNTGTVIGISCNVFEHGFPPKYLPSFSWGSSGIYDQEKALVTAEQVMTRRNKILTHAERELLRTVFEKTVFGRAGEDGTRTSRLKVGKGVRSEE